MRALAVLSLLALAGCTSASPGPGHADPAAIDVAEPEAAPPPPSPTEPFFLDVNGTLWIAPPSGNERSESRVPFRLNGSADVLVTLHLGSTVTPFATADVIAQLRDEAGNVLAQATFSPPGLEPNERTLQAAGAPAGACELHVAAWGGSDGSSGGDYLDYRIEARAPTTPTPQQE